MSSEIPTSQIAQEASSMGLTQKEFNKYLMLRRNGITKEEALTSVEGVK